MRVVMKKLILSLLLGGLTLSAFAVEQQEFVVRDIRIEGLQRVSAGNVFAALPVVIGQTVDQERIADTIRALFLTGQFDDIHLSRLDNVLLITVLERPSISAISISGNKEIKTDDLLENLKEQGVSEGNVLRRDTLQQMEQGLLHSYVSQGRYDATVDIEVVLKSRNRVEVEIDINEGTSAKVVDIHLVGNKAFSAEELLDEFETTTGNWLSWIRDDDRYSREKLRGDLENLRSYYLDRGYLRFQLNSSQVSISDDRKSIYVSLDLDEGEVYQINEVRLVGDLPVDEKLLVPGLVAKKGNTYSQAEITASEENIKSILNNNGFSFAEVESVPQETDIPNQVDISILVQPGRRYYTRKVVFEGNENTDDEVLRREMRQLEGVWASDAQMEISKTRLQRLGLFRSVDLETKEVPGQSDQIDAIYTVEEEYTSSIGGNFGYNAYGFTLGFDYVQSNYQGSGVSTKLSVNVSDYIKSLNFSVQDPYYTLDGTSVGFNVYYNAVDYGNFQVSEYLLDRYGVGLNFRYPIDDVQNLGLSIGYEHTTVQLGTSPAQEVLDFVLSEGFNFSSLTLSGIWNRVTLNHGLFPTRGSSSNLSVLFAVPGSELSYYRVDYKFNYYRPVGRGWVLGARTQLGLLNGYGSTKRPPFFQNYYSGGYGSVRGYEINSLGPRGTQIPCLVDPMGVPIQGTDASGQIVGCIGTGTRPPDPIGGDILTLAGLDLYFPLPFLKDQGSVRGSIFLDVGNVFSQNCSKAAPNSDPNIISSGDQPACTNFKFDELRYSIGVGFSWITGFGPLTFSLSTPFKEGQYDELEGFQFTVGRTF